jgi:translation initiation factor 1 (eIF-1/SUI1)
MSSPVKVITVESINEKIEELEVVRNKLKELLQRDSKSTEEKILQKYIELQHAAKVAEYLNNEGYRIKSNGKLGERKYTSNDVTSIIDINETESDIFHIAKSLYRFNTGKVAWITVYKLCKAL